jgi:Carboxypeptidase regulatory-like domain/TonB-dependent Receptor Plug Domain
MIATKTYAIIFASAVLLIVAGNAAAQRVKSTLSGVVTDASGAGIPGVDVLLTSEGTGVQTTFVTTGDGSYTFPFLEPGSYTVSAKLAGFRTLVRTGVVIRTATDQRLDLRLEIGQVTDQIEVVGQAPLMESVSSTLGKVVDNKKIVDLPLNGRNIYALLNIIPGSTLGGPGGAGIVATNPSINGTRPRGNNFTIDGVAINQEYSAFTGGAGVAYTPQVDAISEFKVVTSNYSAEYGRAMGSIVSLNVKSGTNQIHGTLFEFLRNEVFDARNFFASPTAAKPVLRYNQFGAAVGGPIRKNKLFYFGNIEWTRRRSQAVSTQTVPTAAMRIGDFSGDANVIYDPTTTRTEAGRTIRDPFPNNTIPANRIDPSAKALTEYWPLQNQPGLTANYLSVSGTELNVARLDTKIDYTITGRDTLSGRFSWSDNEQLGAQTFPGPANPNATAYQRTKTPGFQVNYTRTFSPRLINEFRAGYQRSDFQVLGEASALDDWRTKLGLPAIHEDKTLQLGFPYIATTGVGTLGTPYDRFLFLSNTTQFNDTVSWTHGRHFIKLGGSFAHIRARDRIPNFPAGGYMFSGQYTSLPGTAGTGRGFADFLLGISYTAYAGLLVGGGIEPRNNEWGLFLQDDIRISRNLTLNIGFRYDLATAIETEEKTIWSYDPASNTMKLTEPPAPTDSNNFAPRLGFAYQFAEKAVLRGGYGISYFPQFKGLGGFLVYPPVLQQNAFITADPLLAARTFRDNFGSFDSSLSNTVVVTPSLSVDVFQQNNLRSPYVQSWNLTLERQLGSSFVASASYVGNKGTHLENNQNMNNLPLSLLGPNDRFGGLTPQQRRFYPNAGSVSGFANDLNSSYHGLQMSGEWRYSRGLAFLTSYTFAKAIEENRSYIQEAWNRRGSRAVTSSDVPQVFVQSVTYELPFGAGKTWLNHGGLANQILGGWQVNSIVTARDGYPIHMTAASNLSGSFSTLQRPDRLGSGELPANQRTLIRWFDTSAFAIPQQYTFGNAGAFILRGPGMFNIDLSLFKHFRITEGTRIEFRAESFNLTNTPGFGNPNAVIGSATAGQITTLLNPNRSIQFALKLNF